VRELASAKSTVKDLRPLRGATLVPRAASLTVDFASARTQGWEAVASLFKGKVSSIWGSLLVKDVLGPFVKDVLGPKQLRSTWG
jgi:hypothetical protein